MTSVQGHCGVRIADGGLSNPKSKIQNPKWNCRGQSILEYLVLAAIIVAAILVIKPTITTHVGTLYDNAANKTSEAATALGNLTVQVAR